MISPAEDQALVCRLKAEILRLNEQQVAAARMATLAAMAPDAAQQFAERRRRIAKLVTELAVLSQEP